MGQKESRAFIGTSGYSYRHWQERFYPPHLSPQRWLEYYVQHFNSVELNVTFYRLPTPDVFKNWYKRTPKNFIFSIKGSRFISHIKRLKNAKLPLSLFFHHAQFLKEKLNCVLWQLPPAFKLDMTRLEKFVKMLKIHKYRMVFEFRHNSWFTKNVFLLLKEYNYALCLADYPDLKIDMPTNLTNFVYLRRHGANNLYASCYCEDALKKDAYRIRQFLRKNIAVYIYFNNDANAYAVLNALRLKKLLNNRRS